MFRFGSPLKIGNKLYKNKYDDEDKQEDFFIEFTENLIEVLDDF